MVNACASWSWIGWVSLTSLFVGCDAFKYYGPFPNLRKVVTIDHAELGTLRILKLKRNTISSEAAREVRLVNTVREVSVEDCELQDGRRLLESIAEIVPLEFLSLRRCNVTDEDLAGLATAQNLHTLEIVSTDVLGTGLAALSKLPIRTLTLHSTKATAESLQCLADFVNLEELYLSTPELAIDELPSLQKLTRLNTFSVLSGDFAQGGERALSFLAGLPSLRTIHLSAESIDDDAMRSLGSLVMLENLELSRNSVTDSGIAALAPLSNLKTLRIWAGEKLTPLSLETIVKFEQLEGVSLCGAPIHYSETRILDKLKNLSDKDVGMSRWEIEEMMDDQYALASYDPAQERSRDFRGERRHRGRKSEPTSL